MKYAYYCPACKSFWQSESTDEQHVQPCGTCGGAPLFTGYSVEQWKLLSPAEKEMAINALTQRMSESPPQKSAGVNWIKGLRVLCWCSFAMIILAGIVAAVIIANDTGYAFAPFLVVIGSFVVAFASVAVMMVFLGMAEDLRSIRKKLDA